MTRIQYTISIAMVLTIASICNSQERTRILEAGTSYPNQPIAVVGRFLGNRPFIDERKVIGNRDWLSNLALEVKNVSKKEIISFDIQLLVINEGTIVMGIPLRFRTFNRAGGENSLTPEGEAKLGRLRPGEEVKVRISNRDMAAFGNELKKRNLDDVDRLTLDFRSAYFADGTRWYMGQEGPYNPESSLLFRTFKSSIRMHFSDWMSFFLPNDVSCHLRNSLYHPPFGGFFIDRVSVMGPPPPPTCVWFVEADLNLNLCNHPEQGGCTGDDTFCKYEDFDYAVHSTDPGGALKGFLNPEPYLCGPWDIEDPPSCSSCQNYTQDVFRTDENCGLPHGCDQTAAWGCADGLVDVNGVCQKSLDYQNACQSGYDTFACECNPTPTPTPTPTPPVGGCLGDPFPNGSCSAGFVNVGGTCDRSQAFQDRCADPSGYVPCTCPDGTVGGSPIIVDVDNSGFSMTSVENGVDFDLYAASYPLHLSWTSAGTTNAFLVLDRNGNGTIDNGQELFGDITPQPLIVHPNGFNALAEYDKSDNGGNGDGAITASDAVFTQLRLWQDTNHNGISESGELHTLSDLGLASIDLRYKASQRTDQFGNKFYFRAKVTDAQGRQLGRWAWDVFLIVKQ